VTGIEPPFNNPQESRWRLLMRLRWPLGGAIALAFALGQIVEALLLDTARPPARLMLDVLSWGGLGGLAVWVSLTWVSRRERRYQADLERALHEQQALNRQLERSNAQLELLSDVNRQIAESATIDEILDAAIEFPRRLVSARIAALLLEDTAGAVVARLDGATADEFARLRQQLEASAPSDRRGPYYLALRPPRRGTGLCLVLPLNDGAAAIGRVELYQDVDAPLPDDELALLETIASELAEAIAGARRRAREARAIYELERAIAEERARIARDIHDGLAQSLAFQRMRVDLWVDWISSEPARLRDELLLLKRSLREQIVELRRAIFSLRPLQFGELGFAGGLERYITEFAGQNAWEVRVDLAGLPSSLTPELEAICFRVIQEGLNNIAKHAGAGRVEVRVERADNGLLLVIRDDGCGFDPGRAADDASRIGLRQMRERLAGLRGYLAVLSQPGAGAELRAWLPLGE